MRTERKTFWQRLCEAYAERYNTIQPTQEVAAKLIGVTQGSSKKWKAGGLPRMAHAVSLANKLDVCVDWLLTGREPRKPLTTAEATLLDVFRSLPSDIDRGEALGLLKGLAAARASPSLASNRRAAS